MNLSGFAPRLSTAEMAAPTLRTLATSPCIGAWMYRVAIQNLMMSTETASVYISNIRINIMYLR